MDKYTIIPARGGGSFTERLCELYTSAGRYLDTEAQQNRRLTYSKVFLSDAKNQQAELTASALYRGLLAQGSISIVEQPPLDGAKISLLLKTGDCTGSGFLLHSLRLTAGEAEQADAYGQTSLLFEKYLALIAPMGLTLAQHCIRTWIYVSDIDSHYAGVVSARNDIFARHGLTAETHYIASTGIGGETPERGVCVAIDFLTLPTVKEHDKKYLKALTHLNPTHEYGVAFERGTRLTMPSQQLFFISGTASIDHRGRVLYPGNVTRQAGRLLENIGALLADGGATMADIRYFIIYLRDVSDYQCIEQFMTEAFPHIPHIIVSARVCRPEWLVEMECIATRP